MEYLYVAQRHPVDEALGCAMTAALFLVVTLTFGVAASRLLFSVLF